MPKLLTNIRFYTVAGIAQYLASLVDHNEKSEDFDIYGTDISRPGEIPDVPYTKRKYKKFHLTKIIVDYPDLDIVNNLSNGDPSIFHSSFGGIIKAYESEIRRIKPDVILVNGSYFLPWCLLQAAKAYGRAKIVVHYHGVLKKEVEHWPNEQHKANMLALEKDFDSRDILYIFPSQLARNVVEQEVFKHKIAESVVLPNPIAEIFFNSKKRRVGKKRIGVISRWSKIKNMDFVIDMAKYNGKKKEKFEINLITDRKSINYGKKKFNNLIRFRRPIQNHSLYKFYISQGIVMSPSTFETYGNVAQEAIACGTPAFVSKNMGVAEVFRKIGLDRLIIDFDSSANVLRKAEQILDFRIPKESIEQLHDECSSSNVFKKYFSLLSLYRAQ